MAPTLSTQLSASISHRNYWLNGLALLYVLVGYGVALVGITSTLWYRNLLGVFLLIHTLIWAAYFVHEFVHGTVFRRPAVNAFWGSVMLFLTGSCYSRFRDLGRNHMAHHKNRADFSAFSIADFLRSLPKPVQTIIVTLEWLYFPIVNFMLRWMAALAPFLGEKRKDERLRNAVLLAVRGGLFAALAWYSPHAVLLYFLAYICFINILRFLDCFQHTYTVFQFGQSMPQYSLEHEETNTYSNLLSCRWTWPNLLFLNFGYHNAHHRVIHCPWYLLPQLDAELYQPGDRQHVTLAQLVGNYHRFRITRLFNGQGTVTDHENGLSFENFVGGVGVSFLILREPLDWLKFSPDANSAPVG